MNPAQHPQVRLTRRQLLQVGGVSMLGLGLPQLLHASASSGTTRLARSNEKACIFIVQYGGASHVDSWDLKPDAPESVRGPYKPIATNVPGIQVGELFPQLAKQADRYCIVRSMSHRNGGHDGGMHVCMTGHSAPKPETPYFGSVMAKVRPATRNIPSYVWLQNLAGDVKPLYLTGGFLGAAYSPLRIGHDLDNPSNPNFKVTALDPPTDIPPERLHERHDLLAALEPTSSPWLQAPSTGNLRRFQERAVELVAGPDARRAFNLDLESATLRDRYGRHPLGQNLLMARRLIEGGVRLVSVVAWTGVPPGDKFNNVQTWDMHGGGLGGIFGKGQHGLGWALPNTDQAVSALLADLADRGLLDQTLVVMVGEFGRSPNMSGTGRDHWPACYSAMLAGCGIRGGRVWGASDNRGGYVKDNPVSPEDFGATLFTALGVTPETRLGADGFTHPASEGKPLLDLFG
ncbi:hypothetical protein AYO44_07735 [Planctomycetaceae bacterium SCGC AG-212-F19]|nr:hypothetical protein AYO44_07735 [Planctomycetaceae bacterium SCGC AG-212-F19]